MPLFNTAARAAYKTIFAPTIESSPIRKQLCLKSNGLSRFAAEVPAGPEYKEPSEFILDWILEPNLLPKK